jgi:hypothetical protein
VDARARQRLIDDVERWFVRRGLPHAIDDYSAREDVLTRTVPFLSLVFLVEVITTSFGDRFAGWAQAAALLVAVGVVAVGVGIVNRLRRRPWWALPDDIGIAELSLFVLLPAALAWLLDDSPAEAAVLFAVNLGLVLLAFAFAYFGVLPMIVFGLRQVWRRLRTVTQLMARVLPLLLLFVTFVFLNAEMWQVANDFTPLAYAIVTGAITVVAFAFVAVRLPVELDQLARFSSWDEVCAIAAASSAPPLPTLDDPVAAPAPSLDRGHRRNVSVLLFVSYAVQVVLIGIIVAVVLVVLGVLAIRETTIVQWTVQENDRVDALWRFDMGGGTHVLTWGHLAVSGFIGVFSMLQFAVQLIRDEAYRTEFAADVGGDIREVLAVQALYERAVVRSPA